MHDIRTIRMAPDEFDAAIARRGLPPIADRIVAIDTERRKALQEQQEKQAAINRHANEWARRKRAGESTEGIPSDAGIPEARIDLGAARIAELEKELKDTLAAIPNLLDHDVPDGPDETANKVLKQVWGPIDLGFEPKQHFELGEALGMMDFQTAAKMAGSRFTILRGRLARLERALGQFMIDTHTVQHGYVEHTVPYLVNEDTMFGTNQLPKFAEDSFKTTDGRWLIATSEIPLTNTVRGDIVPQDRLPLRLTALTDCFRSEAGASGRDTRGMLRQHQFRKVEMVSITHPDHSDDEHERMTSCAERILAMLELPYRRVLLSSGDTGFGAARTLDLEVWLPGQQMWREISSCSNTRAFQARRMNARYRNADGKVGGFLHTLNGSGVAVGRALIAVMENHQQADGSIRIPQALLPWMAGAEFIRKP